MSDFDTTMEWRDGAWWVQITGGGNVLAEMSLDEWMDLPAVRYAAKEITSQISVPASGKEALARRAAGRPPLRR